MCRIPAKSGFIADKVYEENLNGKDDSIVIETCRFEQRALITLDLDFADIRKYPPKDNCGLIVLRPRSQSKTNVLHLLNMILPMFQTEVVTGKLWIVDGTGVRIRGDLVS